MLKNEPRIIRSKKQYYDLAMQGLVGNSPRTWKSADEFLEASDYGAKTIGIRDTKAAGKFTPYADKLNLHKILQSLGMQQGDYYLTENVKSEEIVLSGELTWFNGQWVFFHSFQKTHMRQALTESGKTALGSDVWVLIKKYCQAEEWEGLFDLFERYSPGHQYPVIEFSITNRVHGIFNQQLLVWEVRHY